MFEELWICGTILKNCESTNIWSPKRALHACTKVCG
jgi:hypothetical protein